MKRYVIEVSESIYGGLHGLNTGGVFEIDDEDEIWEYVIELGTDLIDSYSMLAEAHEGEDPTDCVDYMALPVAPKWDDVSTEELDTQYANLGWDSFVDTYCDFRD